MLIEKYLSTYAEEEATLSDKVEGVFDCAAVVPILGESASIEGLIESFHSAALYSNQNALIVLVINSTKHSPTTYFEDNTHLLNSWKNRLTLLKDTPCAFYHLKSIKPLTVLVIDRHHKPLLDDQGVGTARKIGFDLLVKLHLEGKVKDSFIRSTDADVLVPKDYWKTPPVPSFTSAFIYPFSHVLPEESCEKVSVYLYEKYLRYYKKGLHLAGSPYAFISMGSTLAIEASAYAQVRGFPHRQAGEDFYVLNKLSKLGPISQPKRAPIQIRYRPSLRTPFGTGVKTHEWSHAKFDRHSPLFPHPKSFEILREFIQSIDEVTKHRNVDIFQISLYKRVRTLCTPCVAANTLWILGDFKTFWAFDQAIDTRPKDAALKQHLHSWFDALKTYRFIKSLTENCFSYVSYHSIKSALSKHPHLQQDPHPLEAPL